MGILCVCLGEGDTTPTTTSLDGKFAGVLCSACIVSSKTSHFFLTCKQKKD